MSSPRSCDLDADGATAPVPGGEQDLHAHFRRVDRPSLEDLTVACLGHGPHQSTRPLVRLVDLEGVRAVVKDFGEGGSLARGAYGAWMVRRESRAYRFLEGLPGVPRFLGTVDAHALVIEFIPGDAFRGVRGLELPGRYFDTLRAVIESMHGRGVIHLDLSQRKNFLIRDDGSPFVIDFASAVVFRHPRWNPLFWLGRWFDRSSLAKLERKYRRNWSE